MRAGTAWSPLQALGVLLALAGCDPIAAAIAPSAPAFPDSEPQGPLTACEAACSARAGASCSARDCRRGCGIVIDRWVEREGDHVLRCVAAAKPRCDDRAWAACAARIGPHADGGPPAPLPPSEDDVE
jgi:hypothetical protein